MTLETQASWKPSEEGENGGNVDVALMMVIGPAVNLPLTLFREIPLELRQRARGGQVNLDMEDHRDEDYFKPKVAFKAFEGEGQKLGRCSLTFYTTIVCVCVFFLLLVRK